MNESNAKKDASATDGIDALFGIEQNSLKAMANTYASLFNNIARAQAEAFRFLSERFVKDTQSLGRFAACKSPADVAQLQMELGSAAIADYMEEMQQMLGQFERTANDAMASAT